MRSKLIIPILILLVSFGNPNLCLDGKNILYVGGYGEGNYSKIQDAINAAKDGDIIFVYDDSSPYYENIIINKSISLIGENKEATIIDGNKKGDVVKIISNGVKISGFTIRNSKEEYESAGIVIHNANNIIIEDNIIIENGDQGIRIYSSDNNVIKRNIISNNVFYGIWLYSSKNNIIEENEFYNNGIVLREGSLENFIHKIGNNSVNGKPLYYFLNMSNFSSPSNAGQIILVNCKHVKIENLSISKTSVAVEIAYSSDIKILNNNFSDNNLNGIRLCYSSNNEIVSNIIKRNGWSGISLWFDCNNNLISNNIICYNYYDDLELLFASNNNLVLNNFIHGSPYGIGLRDSDGNVVRLNNIFNHSEYGLIAINSNVDARFNYWGSFFGTLLGDKIAWQNSKIKIFPWIPFQIPIIQKKT